MRSVIYLTGPPAVGKSTLCRNLLKEVPELEILHYSVLLRDYLAEKGDVITEDGIRESSANIVTPQIIEEVDDLLISRVQELRIDRPVIIDSHPVTKESYGYRVTPFRFEKLRQLAPTHICLLYSDSQTIIERIAENPQGRPVISPFESDFHLYLQSQVAVSYGLDLGLPIYALENGQGSKVTFEKILSWVRLS